MRFIILDFCINVHSCFAIFMPGEILNGFGVYAHIQKICNVGVPELVRGHMEVQTIHMVWEAFPTSRQMIRQRNISLCGSGFQLC